MASVKRTLYAYDIIPIKGAAAKYKMPDDVLKDIKIVMEDLVGKSEIFRRKDYDHDNKILYVDLVKYDEEIKFIIIMCVITECRKISIIIVIDFEVF